MPKTFSQENAACAMAQKKPPHGRLLSYRADHAAGYFCPGVPGRLGSEIIPPAVDDYGAANDLRCAEAVGQHGHKRMAAAGKQGRQVAGVVRMRTAAWVVVPLGIGKILAAAGIPLIYMKSF